VNNFADVYRIASSAPTSSLDIGDLYFDTTSDTLKVYGASGWQSAGSSINGTSQRYHYDISGTPTSVTGADANGNTLSYDAGYVDVYVNGVRMSQADITVTSGDTVTFTEALADGDEVDIVGYGTFAVASLNADNLDSGTVPSARVSGAYTGITTAGQLTFADNEKAIFGAGDDLQIYHDGATSYISDQGTGNLKVLAQNFIVSNPANTETMIAAAPDAGVSLYYDAAAKLATTSTGIDVTSIDATISMTGTRGTDSTHSFTTGGANSQNLLISTDSTSGNGIYYNSETHVFRNQSGASEAMRIDANGHVTKPLQPAFSAKPTSTQSNIAVNSFVKVLFATEIFDQNGDFASSTFTAPTTGRYQLSVNLYILGGDTASGFYQMKLETSNRNYLVTIEPAFTSDMSYFSFFNLSILADMDAGDTAEVYFYQSSGTAQTDISSASYFMGYLVA
jgi:predicted RecA/RadA family phage recombinase